MGDICTPDQAQAWLKEDIREAEDLVNHFVTVPLTQGQFDALCSIVFNVGPGVPCNANGSGGRDGIIWLRQRGVNGSPTHSTLFRLLEAGQRNDAAMEFPHWKQPATLPGILRRRMAEQALFLT